MVDRFRKEEQSAADRREQREGDDAAMRSMLAARADTRQRLKGRDTLGRYARAIRQGDTLGFDAQRRHFQTDRGPLRRIAPGPAAIAVIESFVLREGTDYGEKEFSLEDKVARVVSQLKKGEARIVFDPESESVTIALRQNSR